MTDGKAPMPFLEVMHAYFRGERVEALYFIVPIGVAMLAFAAVTLRAERGGFAWGLAIPLIGLELRFGLKADWAHGVGPALILIGAMGSLIDSFPQRRARPYTMALEALAAEHRAELPDE